MERKLYAAYGSNLNIQQMRRRCPGAAVYGKGILKGYELQFRGRSGCAFLTIEPKEDAVVPVGIWSVSSDDELALDQYEGYPRLYGKRNIRIPVVCEKTGEEPEAEVFVYVMREGFSTGLPTQGYIDCCLDGYRAFGFSKMYILNAIKRAGRSGI